MYKTFLFVKNCSAISERKQRKICITLRPIGAPDLSDSLQPGSILGAVNSPGPRATRQS